MTFTYSWHLYLMALLYILAGINHFIKPKTYLRIMPHYLPSHKSLVFWSGVAEIILGLGICFSTTKNISLYGIITMLLVFLLVHFYMITNTKAAMGLPKWLLITRVILQFGLIWWAVAYLKL